MRPEPRIGLSSVCVCWRDQAKRRAVNDDVPQMTTPEPIFKARLLRKPLLRRFLTSIIISPTPSADELGHNLGALHDRQNAGGSTEYSHGLRYCYQPFDESA